MFIYFKQSFQNKKNNKTFNNIYRSIAPCLGYVNQVSFYNSMEPIFSDLPFSELTPTLKSAKSEALRLCRSTFYI